MSWRNYVMIIIIEHNITTSQHHHCIGSTCAINVMLNTLSTVEVTIVTKCNNITCIDTGRSFVCSSDNELCR